MSFSTTYSCGGEYNHKMFECLINKFPNVKVSDTRGGAIKIQSLTKRSLTIKMKKPGIDWYCKAFTFLKYFLFVRILLKRNRVLILIRHSRCCIAAVRIKILNCFCTFRSRAAGEEQS